MVTRPQVDTSNMSASQKKNLKKKIRKQEQRQQDAAVLAAVRPESAKSGAGMASYYAEQEAGLRRRLEGIKRVLSQFQQGRSRSSAGGAAPNAKKIAQDIDSILRDMDATVQKEESVLQKPLSKRLTVQQLQQQVRDVETQVQKQQRELQRQTNQGGAECAEVRGCLEESLRYVMHLREQLVLTQQQSEFRAFRERVAALKAEGEALVKGLHAGGGNSPGGSGEAASAPSSAKEAQWRRRLGDLARGGSAGGRREKRGPNGKETEGDGEANGAPAAPLVIQSVHLGLDALGLLFPGGQNPVMVRKFERSCGVVIEKQSGGRVLTVIGLQAPGVERCVALLKSLDEGMQPDKREKHRVVVTGRTVGSVIGAGGANLRRVEEENDVVVWAEGNEMIVMGVTPAKIADGIRQLKEMMAAPVPAAGSGGNGTSMVLSFTVPVARALGGPGFRPFIHKLEGEYECSVRAPKGGTEGVVLVLNAGAENLAAAAKAIKEEAEKLVVKTIRADNDKVLKLLKGSAPGFSASAREKDYVTYLRGDNELTVVAPSGAIEEAVKAAEEGLLQLDRVTEQLTVPRSQLRVITRAKRAQIEESTGVVFRPPRNGAQGGADAVFAFSGTKEQVEAARTMLETVLREEGYNESMSVSKEMTAALLADRGQGVRDLEEQFSVSISIERQNRCLVVRGNEAAVQTCLAALRERQAREFDEDKDDLVVERVPVRKDQISAIIGRQGARIRKIQADSGVESIRIDDADGVAAVRGSAEAVAKAVKLIEEALKEVPAAAGGAPHGGQDDGEEERAGEGEHHAPARAGRGRRGGHRGGAAIHGVKRAPQKPLDVDASDETAFPSLDAAAVNGSKGRAGGRWKRGARRAEEVNAHVMNGVTEQNGSMKDEVDGVASPGEDATIGSEVGCN
ncbi:FUSE-binding protein 2 / KH-type splicing regulatory protein [Besnoitia besnoiti]|uniref:FUSE-binding protein 2 / KH-type splicing regulatory protein n=1 Tax=Besnoitia besnoiti TaxID=94643 RepID=A0A2A9MER7_BESBE|nr:FUSE-binding protein 2 / KH-type splicing regulatory protein [Besnoitia besnoiti]PFH34761.1 FUSE-binding protein 2 / KH-type splicing regulatory protein [Besnoitia besnoiti]